MPLCTSYFTPEHIILLPPLTDCALHLITLLPPPLPNALSQSGSIPAQIFSDALSAPNALLDLRDNPLYCCLLNVTHTPDKAHK